MSYNQTKKGERLLKQSNHQVNLVFDPDYAAEEHIHQVYLVCAYRALN